MKGKLIAVDAIDSCGKETQSKELVESLKKLASTEYVSFPNYKSRSSEPVKMYLEGLLGDKPSDVNPYAASCLYLVDRLVTYKTELEKLYNEGSILVADRYTTANIIHQVSKLDNENDKIQMIKWIEDVEYEKCKLPKPDMVIYLYLDPDVSIRLNDKRKVNNGCSAKKDIHEKDTDFQRKSSSNGLFAAKYLGWNIVDCTDYSGEAGIRPVGDIHKEIFELVRNKLGI